MGRLVVLARKRIAAGVYGKSNAGWRLLIPGFTTNPKQTGRLLFNGIRRWLRMELGAMWLGRKSAAAPVNAEAPREGRPEPVAKA